MKLFAALSLAAALTAPPALAQESVEAGIESVLTAQQAAWNAGDIETFMQGYWDSPDLRFASGGSVTYGFDETLRAYRERYGGAEAMGRLSFTDLDIEPLSDDAAMAFGRWRLDRKTDAPGGLFTLIFRKKDGDWVIVHDHTSAGEAE